MLRPSTSGSSLRPPDARGTPPLLAATAALVLVAGCRPTPIDDATDPEGDVCQGDCPDTDDGGSSSDSNPSGPQIRVATFNVQRLFDTECDTNQCRDGFEDKPSEFQYNRDIERVVEGLDQLDADLVLLQEIEKRSSLEEIAAEADYSATAFGETGSPASLDVGVLARGELIDSRGYQSDRLLERPDGSQTRFAREFLRADLEIEGRRVIAFTSHFTSRVVEDDPGRRLAEAREAAAIIDETSRDHPDAAILFGGDLNDFPNSDPLRALRDTSLALAATERPMRLRWTYCFEERTEAIDHLLSVPDSNIRYIEQTGRAVGNRACPGNRQFAGSDHAAFVAAFRL